jgi:hypothetical protein
MELAYVAPELEPVELDEPAPFRPEERAPRPQRPGAGPSFAPHASSPPRRQGRLLPSAPALFPWLARRLVPGEATIVAGAPRSVAALLELLYAGSAAARGRISLLEGANRFDPYRIGELGRALGVDATETVRRIRLARAFTAYQMVALVDRWATEARRDRPTLLVGHDLPSLFHDAEIPEEEQDGLLRHVARALRAVCERAGAPLLLTLGPDGAESFPSLAEDGPRWCDYLRLERGPSTVRLEALRDGGRFAIVPRPPGQAGLESFGVATGTEVMAWGAPFRRTARRSRSG